MAHSMCFEVIGHRLKGQCSGDMHRAQSMAIVPLTLYSFDSIMNKNWSSVTTLFFFYFFRHLVIIHVSDSYDTTIIMHELINILSTTANNLFVT